MTRAGTSGWAAARAVLVQLYPHPLQWGLALFVVLVDGVWIGLSQRLSITPDWAQDCLLVLAACGLLAGVRHWRAAAFGRRFDCLFQLSMVLLLSVLVKKGLRVLNHLVMSVPAPLADEALLRWDRALGFDWNAYAGWVASQDWLRDYLWLAYVAFPSWGLMILLAGLILLGKHDRVNELCFLFTASALACILIAGFFPAEAARVTLASDEVTARLGPEAWSEWNDQFRALRGGGPILLDPEGMRGLATFPSFHTCMALILLWCSRGHALAFTLGSIAGLSVLAATPVFGGHYLVDVIAGTVLCVVLALPWRRPGLVPGPAWGRAAPPF